MTREEMKKVLFTINVNKRGFMPETERDQTLLVNLWFNRFEQYDFQTVMDATFKMIDTGTFGLPEVSDVMKHIKGDMKNQDLGIEFADYVFKVRTVTGRKLVHENGENFLDKVGPNGAELVEQKFGSQYVPLFEEYCDIIGESSNDSLSYVRDRLAKRFNSENERFELHGTTEIGFTNEEATDMISEMKSRGLEFKMEE